MNFEINNKYLGNWLTQLNDKEVDKIYAVAFNDNIHDGKHLPYILFLTFSNFNKFLEIERDFDCEHIKINIGDIIELNQKVSGNSFKDNPDLCNFYTINKTETLGLLIKKTINKIEYGIDKDEFIINNKLIKGQKDIFTFIRFYLDSLILTIFEGGRGIYASDNKEIKLDFEETFDTYKTK